MSDKSEPEARPFRDVGASVEAPRRVYRIVCVPCDLVEFRLYKKFADSCAAEHNRKFHGGKKP
jgi:hypothetical protein